MMPALQGARVPDADPNTVLHIRRPVWGMTCAACAADITDAIGALPGVRRVLVNPASHWLEADVLPDVGTSQWLERLNAAIAPFACHLLEGGVELQRDASRRNLRQSLFRLLIAALLWMQIMMYAWPEYSPDAQGLTGQDVSLLRWAQWMLCLPLMIFCARPVFRSAWKGLRRARPGLDVPASFALVAAFVVSTQATFSGQGSVWFDSLSMFLLFLLGARHLLEWLRHQSLLAVLDAQPDLPQTVRRQDSQAGWTSVDVNDLRVGDICFAKAGELLAGDGVLLSQRATVSEALITGESDAVTHASGDVLYAGSCLLENDLVYRITALGADSAVGQIQQQMIQAVCSRPARFQWVDRLALPLLAGIVLASVFAGLWAHHRAATSGGGDAWSVALAVLMVSCPCAISLAAPVAWISAAMRLKRKGVMLRNTDALQVMCTITDVVFDKTGTLTGQAWVERLQWMSASDPHALHVLHAMARTSAATSRHPLSRAVDQWLGGQELALLRLCGETAGHGVQAVDVNGTEWRMGRADWCGAQVDPKLYDTRTSDTGISDTSRPDASLSQVYLSRRNVSQQDGWMPVCCLHIRTGLRAGVDSLLDTCRQKGWRVHLWSGDQPEAVSALATQLNIMDARARMSPSDKLSALEHLRVQGARVLVVGDGLNDAPMIAAADVSVAMADGSQTAQMQSDAIVLGLHVQGIEELIVLSHRLSRTVRHNMAWALAYNMIAIPLAATGFLTPLSAGVGMALSSAVVTLNAMRLMRGVKGN